MKFLDENIELQASGAEIAVHTYLHSFLVLVKLESPDPEDGTIHPKSGAAVTISPSISTVLPMTTYPIT